MLKIYDKKKALFYLVPLHGAIKISMAIRESEKEAFLADTDMTSYYKSLHNARNIRRASLCRGILPTTGRFHYL